MLSGSAPALHLYPMQRYMYGAWELPDNAMALLKSHQLVDQRRATEPDAENAGRARRDYFLLRTGAEVLASMRDSIDQLGWYDLQAEAIALLSVGVTGAAARARQYEQPEYAATPIGQIIAAILDRTVGRFEKIAEKHGYVAGNAQVASTGETGEQ